MTDHPHGIRIIHYPTDADPFCVIDKGILPSAPLHEGDDCALTRSLRLVPSLDAVAGKAGMAQNARGTAKSIERGLIHRLDNDTSGLLLIAATQDAYTALSRSQDAGLFTKSYLAATERVQGNTASLHGYPPPPFPIPVHIECPIVVRSRFRAYGEGRRAVRPVTENSGMAAAKAAARRIYETVIKMPKGIEYDGTDKGGKQCVLCTTSAGFRHQVRCHLSWLDMPVAGDALYNSRFAGGPLQFKCIALSFPHPLTGAAVTYTLTGEK